jgi:hypothetical protein
MSTPNEVGAALAEIHARTGWSWAEVANQVGTTPTYARKLATGAGKFGNTGAGAALRSNLAGFQATGTAQAPYQRQQAVRAAGGGSRPAERRTVPSSRAAFKVERSVFRGGAGRDGWAVQVTVPRHASKTGDREDARNAITDAVRRAAQGGRRVAFRVTVKDPNAPGGRRIVELAPVRGYAASGELAAIRGEGGDPLAMLVAHGLTPWYQAPKAELDLEQMDDLGDEDETGSDILAVEVIALP